MTVINPVGRISSTHYLSIGKAMSDQERVRAETGREAGLSDISTQFRGEIEALIKQLQPAMADAIRGMDDRPAAVMSRGLLLTRLRNL